MVGFQLDGDIRVDRLEIGEPRYQPLLGQDLNRDDRKTIGPGGTVKLSRICPFCGRILLDQRLRINDLAVAAGGENAAKLLNLTVPAPMRKDQVDLANAVVWIPDSKTPTGVGEVPLTDLAVEAFRDQLWLAGPGSWLFPSGRNQRGFQASFKKIWRTTLERAGVPYFRIYDLRSTYATRLSAGGVADEWVTQLLRQSDSKVFKKYSQMKLGMKREALRRLNRQAGEEQGSDTLRPKNWGFDTVLIQLGPV